VLNAAQWRGVSAAVVVAVGSVQLCGARVAAAVQRRMCCRAVGQCMKSLPPVHPTENVHVTEGNVAFFSWYCMYRLNHIPGKKAPMKAKR